MVEILAMLAAAVIAVLLFNRLGLGTIIGYLAAGAAIGPSGLQLVTDPDDIRHVGEFGVVFLLFMIGIEIKPRRLWVMRKVLLGLGGAQVLLTGLAFSLIARMVVDLPWATAGVIGFGLALSSTAFAVQIMSDKGQLSTQWGRASFSILLMQDLAVVPLVALVPLIASGGFDLSESVGLAVLESLAILAGVLAVGRFATGPALKLIARERSEEAFAAAALLLVLGTAWLMDVAGLSMAMGAFVAGTLMAENEYRHQIVADIEPFRGLLLGLFFLSVGMAIDPNAIIGHLSLVVGGTLALLGLKTLIVFVIARLARLDTGGSIRAAFLLSQAGEFGFVLFTLADNDGILPDGWLEPLVSIAILSMALTPLMTRLGGWLADRLGSHPTSEEAARAEAGPVVIVGFGRGGAMVGRMLGSVEVPWVGVDRDVDRVTAGRAAGHRIFFGDSTREDLLRAVGVPRARLVVVTLDDTEAAAKVVRAVYRLRADLPILARAKDSATADLFRQLGATQAVPETLEASIRLGRIALDTLGVRAREELERP